MAVLHGSWLFRTPLIEEPSELQTGCLLIWGEAWRRLEPSGEETSTSLIPAHPYSMNRAELVEVLNGLQQSKRIDLPILEAVSAAIAKPQGKRGKEQTIAAETARWRSQILALPSAVLESE